VCGLKGNLARSYPAIQPAARPLTNGPTFDAKDLEPLKWAILRRPRVLTMQLSP